MTDFDQVIKEAKKSYKLMIATGFYEVKAYAPQIPCLMASQKALDLAGIEHDYIQLCGDSYVDRCKNALVHKFLQSDCSHLMILDSDETWQIDGFLRLIKASLAGCEIVGGLYPCKNNWEFYGGHPKRSEDGYLMGREIGDMRLVEMEMVPGGFLIYHRNAFERTRPNLDSYRDPESKEDILECFRRHTEFADLKVYPQSELEKMEKDELINIVMQNQRGGRVGHCTGEDIYFQNRYKEMGGIIWCEPNISMSHFGVKEWKGNYNDFLLREKAKNEVEMSIGATPEDTEAMLNDISDNLKKLKEQKCA